MELISFDPVKVMAIVAMISVFVQFLKSSLEKIEEWNSAPVWVRKFAEFWAHSQGPAIISVIVSLFVTTLPAILEDGSLTFPELRILLEALGLAALANVTYWISRLKNPLRIFGK